VRDTSFAPAPTESARREHPTLRDRIEPVVRAWRPLSITWLALLGLVIVADLLLVGPFEDGLLSRWDLDAAHWFVEARTATLDTLAEIGTWLAETITVSVLLVVAIIVAWRVSDNVAAPVFIAITVGGEKLLYLIASLVVDRDRPPVPTVGTTYATSSFPSGHLASAITLYGSIALLIALHRSRRVRLALLAVVGAISLVVALCRMYTGFHYLTDCIAGAVVGVVWLVATYHFVLLPAERAAANRVA